MNQPTLPNTEEERQLELAMHCLIYKAIEQDMPLIGVLCVLERLRFLTTEMILELQNGA